MADYTLSKTGSQIDTILGKADKLPTLSSGDNGKTLQVDSSGNIVANSVSGGGGGTTLYRHTLLIPNNYTNSSSVIFLINDNTTSLVNAQIRDIIYDCLSGKNILTGFSYFYSPYYPGQVSKVGVYNDGDDDYVYIEELYFQSNTTAQYRGVSFFYAETPTQDIITTLDGTSI